MPRKNLLKTSLRSKVSTQTTEMIYGLGYGHYQNGRYEDAAHFFRYLTLIDHESARNWLGLGLSCLMTKKYSEALQSFACASLLDKANPLPHLYASRCFSLLGERKQQQEALELAANLAAKDIGKFKKLNDYLMKERGGE